MQQVFDITFHRVMCWENFSRGGFPLPSPQFMIRSILLSWWSCSCFTGMVSAPHAKQTASVYWRNIKNIQKFRIYDTECEVSQLLRCETSCDVERVVLRCEMWCFLHRISYKMPRQVFNLIRLSFCISLFTFGCLVAVYWCYWCCVDSGSIVRPLCCTQDILGVGLEAPLTLCKVIYTLPMLTIKEDKGEFQCDLDLSSIIICENTEH